MRGERQFAGIIDAAEAPGQRPVIGLFLQKPFVQERVERLDAGGRGLERNPEPRPQIALPGKEVEFQGESRGERLGPPVGANGPSVNRGPRCLARRSR